MTPTAAAPTPPETAPHARIQQKRNLRPLGEQLIIRTIPVGSIGSLFVPDTAQSITMMGSGNKPVATDYLISASLLDDLIAAIDPKTRRRINIAELLMRAEKARKTPATNNLSDAVHFVEAEVIAVGPGKRQKGDPDLIKHLWDAVQHPETMDGLRYHSLLERVKNTQRRLPSLVKPGDRILYHPSVQRFDRDITSLMTKGDEGQGVKYFMIREDSVLAIIDK